MTETLSRQLARFTSKLTYEDLPSDVAGKVKARILHALGTGLAAYDDSFLQQFWRLIKTEEGQDKGGATILVDGSRVSRPGAAFANCALMRARQHTDSYQLLTHPAAHTVPASLAIAEGRECTGRVFIAGVAAGLEVGVRICSNPEVIPATQARGFRSSALYSVFEAATAAGKLLAFNEDQMVDILGLASTFACGTVEGVRGWGGELLCQDPMGTRNGVWAALLVQAGVTGTETSLDGLGGFYHGFTGNRDWDFTSVTERLGEHFELTNIQSKGWPQKGYLQTPIWLSISMAKEHNLKPEEIQGVELEVYEQETTYPSPAFPNPPATGVNATALGVAVALVEHDYPQFGPTVADIATRSDLMEKRDFDPRILDLMKRIKVRGTKERKLYFPKLTVTLKNGTTYTGELNGLEALKWGLKEEQDLMQQLAPGVPIPRSQFDELVATVSELERLPNIDRLVQLTLPPS